MLNHYSVERSIADGATLPIHVETRLVDFHIDHDALDQAFDELAEAEGLDERRDAASLAERASAGRSDHEDPGSHRGGVRRHRRALPAKVAPLGLKAQVVAFDRELCVAYHDAITALLEPGEEATVVMTTAKDDPAEWAVWDRDRDAEAKIKDRFRDADDPLKFLIVTAKLLTGFDAPDRGRHVPRQAAAGAHAVPGGLPHQPAMDEPAHRPGEAARPDRRLRRAWATSWPRPWP